MMEIQEIREIVEVVLVVEHHAAIQEIQELPEETGELPEMVVVPVPQLVRGMLEFSTAPQIHLEVEKSIIDVI